MRKALSVLSVVCLAPLRNEQPGRESTMSVNNLFEAYGSQHREYLGGILRPGYDVLQRQEPFSDASLIGIPETRM